MSTLLYLASGQYCKEYENLPFDNLIFVDRSLNYESSYPTNNPRITFIRQDALTAIDILKNQKIKIDCLVSVNEGLYEGGGNYPIFSDFLMGYLLPLLKNEFILICDLDYYSGELRTPMSKLDWGIKKIKELTPLDSSFIDPAIFSYSQRIRNDKSLKEKKVYGHVFQIQKIRNEKEIKLNSFSKTKIKLINSSIWDDYSKLDFIGLNLQSNFHLGFNYGNFQTSRDFFNSKAKILDIRNLSLEDILIYCVENSLKRIGLTPWCNGDYNKVISTLKILNEDRIKSISFYHLNKKDYKELYRN